MVLYGLQTCDSCRKALKAIRDAGRNVEFRDVRKEPLGEEDLRALLDTFGDALVNRASATWRGLSEEERGAAPKALLARHPALMKRPVIRDGVALHLGWNADVQARVLN